VVVVEEPQSIIILFTFDCDWSILTTITTYDYIYAIVCAIVECQYLQK